MKKNKPTIFGEESFIIPNMAEQLYHKEIEFIDDVLVSRIACDFNLDKDKVKRQLELCARLENIDKTDLIDMATKKKFADKDYEIKVLQEALELACERVKYFEEMQDTEMGFSEFFGYDSDYDLQAIIEQYKKQAKEMLENE